MKDYTNCVDTSVDQQLLLTKQSESVTDVNASDIELRSSAGSIVLSRQSHPSLIKEHRSVSHNSSDRGSFVKNN